MPTIDENRKMWDERYEWTRGGDEWSALWGSPSMQWYGTILPRIHHFVPTGSILEIACGYGRWTRFLKDICHNLVAVDLSEKCIEACRQRFSQCQHAKFHVTDGKSLEMIPDHSVDFVFSFDSLVHVDESVLKAYISQLPRILTDDGAVFIHHSNLGEYSLTYSTVRRVPRLEWLLTRLHIIERSNWRDAGVSAKVVERLAQEHGLRCMSQELANWRTKRHLTDCFSTIVRGASSSATGENRIFRNAGLMREAKNLSRLSALYGVE